MMLIAGIDELAPDGFREVFYSTILPSLRDKGMSASPWVNSFDGGAVLVAWTMDSDPDRAISEVTDTLQVAGLRATVSALRPLLQLAGLPNPTTRMAFCDLQYNPHGIHSQDLVACPQGHGFARSHAFDYCTHDGQQLS